MYGGGRFQIGVNRRANECVAIEGGEKNHVKRLELSDEIARVGTDGFEFRKRIRM